MPRVTLSFDNGPEPEVTPRVLDCLAQHEIRSTFFVLGGKIVQPERAKISRRALAEGHWIGNHTFTHSKPLGEMDRDPALEEFDRTEAALDCLFQAMPPQRRLFRPYGRGLVGTHLLHPAVAERINSKGVTCVLWNSLPGDWRDPDGWVAHGLEQCRAQEWSLVVLHDLPTGAMAHLSRFISCLKSDGFELTQEFPPDCLPALLEPYTASVTVPAEF